MKIKDITQHLESLAPLSSQESYDNSGLLVGNQETEVTGVLISLDCTEKIVEEAKEKGCNLIISHHPIIFGGLKKLTGQTYVERVVEKSIRYGIALYAIHTNLDNYQYGVNFKIGQRLGLSQMKVLAPAQNTLNKLVVYAPISHKELVLNALFCAGAGKIGNYDECSFSSVGNGTFRPLLNAHPTIGELNELTQLDEARIEVLVSKHRIQTVLTALFEAHPYEEVAYDLVPLLNKNQFEGAGMIGDLPEEMDTVDFLNKLKLNFSCGIIRHTELVKKRIKKVAFCGGSGFFLLKNAIQSGADIFITGDVKYHEFFDADGSIILADIGHYESEQFTSDLIADQLKEKFTTFAVHLTENNTNPINYL
jgi:dinuclear metal center YbgI/SA1388 family protein